MPGVIVGLLAYSVGNHVGFVVDFLVLDGIVRLSGCQRHFADENEEE